jgi:ADP-heptose:LPS heptosyltransferase
MKTIRIISWGGIGDALLTTPSFKALKEKYPNSRVVVYCPLNSHKEVFLHNPYIDSIKKFYFLSAPVDLLRYYTKSACFMMGAYGTLSPSKFYSKTAMRIIGEMLGVPEVKDEIQIFLTSVEDEMGKKIMSKFPTPIVFQSKSGCSDNKNWGSSKWEQLIQSMPEYSFIQLGSRGEPLIPGAINMLGKTLRESFAMIKHAASFIGVESCFAHATNAFNLPGVVLFGPSTPVLWGHSNNINLYRKLPCAPCLDLLLDERCPYGKPCMDISVDEVRSAVLKQLRVQHCNESDAPIHSL